MKIVIFGSTGGTGREIVKQGLEHGHEVTAFARNAAKLNDLWHGELKIIEGDAVDYAAVERAIVGQDAVLSALGSPTLKKNTVLTEATVNIIKAMEKHGVRRFICETSLGVGDSRDQPGLIFNNLVVPFFLKNAFAEKELQERLIKKSELDWIIVRPGRLTNGNRTGNYRYGLNKSITGSVSRADVADFMLRQLNSDEYLHQTPAICT